MTRLPAQIEQQQQQQQQQLPSHQPRGLRPLWRFLRWGVLLLAAAVLFDVAYAFATLPKLPPGGFDPSRPTMVFAADGNPVGPLSGGIFRVPAGLDEMPRYLPEGFIASEDIRFREHAGIDPRGIARAMLTNLRNGEIREGGSTITQQVVKNTFLTSRRTLRRKLQEAAMSVALERRYTKDEILSLYLNQIYLGHGAYGVGAAAQLYFSKDVADLTLAEAATLIGITPAPESFSPLRHPDLAQKQRDLVLDRMAAAGVLEQSAAAKAKAQPLHVHQGEANLQVKFPWYMDALRRELRERYGLDERAVELMGLKVHTGLDPTLQRAAENALAVKRFPASAPDGIQGAFAAVDPRNGEIRALVGGREYTVAEGLNRATDGQVAPGSTLKPVAVYAPAIEYAGMTPDSTVEDSPLNLDGWKPQNADRQFRGEVTVREATRLSLNVPAIRIMSEVGVNRARSFAANMGIPFTDQDDSLTLALGGMERGLSPLQLAGAYQAFANGGTYHEPHLIVRVEAADGQLVPESLRSKRVMKARTAFHVTDMLKTVVQSGTGQGALLDRPMAGKTGTVELPGTPAFEGREGNAAAWFVGYTPDLVGSVWVGYDQVDGQHYLPTTVNGSTHPTAIWREAVGPALARRPALPFPGPDGRTPPPPAKQAEPAKPAKPSVPDPVKPPAIRGLKAAPSEKPGSVNITWEAEKLPITGVFVVFRGTAPDFAPDLGNTVSVVPTPGALDTPPGPGTYFYRVASMDLATREMGEVSASISVTITDEQTKPPEEEKPPTTEPELPTTDPEPPTTDPEPPTTDPEPPTTDPEPPTTNPEPPTTNPEPPTTNPEPPTTDPESPTTDPEPPTTEPQPPGQTGG